MRSAMRGCGAVWNSTTSSASASGRSGVGAPTAQAMSAIRRRAPRPTCSAGSLRSRRVSSPAVASAGKQGEQVAHHVRVGKGNSADFVFEHGASMDGPVGLALATSAMRRVRDRPCDVCEIADNAAGPGLRPRQTSPTRRPKDLASSCRLAFVADPAVVRRVVEWRRIVICSSCRHAARDWLALRSTSAAMAETCRSRLRRRPWRCVRWRPGGSPRAAHSRAPHGVHFALGLRPSSRASQPEFIRAGRVSSR